MEDSAKILGHVTIAWIEIWSVMDLIWITHIDLRDPMKALTDLEIVGELLDKALADMETATTAEVT
jgi:hypothetical protein